MVKIEGILIVPGVNSPYQSSGILEIRCHGLEHGKIQLMLLQMVQNKLFILRLDKQ